MNFHKDLLSMGQEVHYWERMRMPIPYIAMEINAQREKYRVLRDNILMVVRDYNKVRRGGSCGPVGLTIPGYLPAPRSASGTLIWGYQYAQSAY